jgi:hypothetical protein
MRRLPLALALLALVAAALALPRAAAASHPAVERARRAVASGRVDPARDVGPLLAALRAARTVEERRELVGAIGDLGETDGDSPNAVKSYLAEEAPPVLLDVIRNGHDAFLQGDAVTALRGMSVPRAVLVEAADIAEADPDAFVRSRGEILRNLIRSMPEEDERAAARPVATEASRKAIAYLDQLGVGVSTQALRDAARDGNAEIVKALLDAGVAPDTGARRLEDTPLYLATRIGCSSQQGEADWVVETVRHLVAAGANVNMLDDNKNTALMFAADECGKKTVAVLLEAGAKIDARNGSGLTALGFALLYDKLDAADLLVAKGARLTKAERAMLEPSLNDARARAILKKAGAGG